MSKQKNRKQRRPHLEILENRRLLTASADEQLVALNSIQQYGTALFGSDWQADLGLDAAQIQQHIEADTWRSALNDSPAPTISQIRNEAQFLGAETLQSQIDNTLAQANLPSIDVREFDWLQEPLPGPAALADYFADGEIIEELMAEGETFTVQLTTVSGPATLDSTRSQSTVKILENDLEVAIFDANPVTEGDIPSLFISGMPKATFRVTISSARPNPVEIPISLLNGNPEDPPAHRGPDYYYWTTTTPGIDDYVIFQPGDTEKFVEVPIVSDVLHEYHTELFYVQIGILNEIQYIVNSRQAKGTIFDDDDLIDLDAALIQHNQASGYLAESEEETIGAFLPVNNDDDDYDQLNEPDLDQDEQSGPIANETDLLPLKLSKFKPNLLGTFSLSIPDHIRLWMNPDRTNPVLSTTGLDSQRDWDLYAEAISEATGTLSVWWSSIATYFIPMLGDEVKLTSFTWNGPLNVPGHAIYNYTATMPPETMPPGTSHWVSPINGSLKSGAGTNNVEILWDGGPVIGKAACQANHNYLWDLEVNVVLIDIAPEQVTTDVNYDFLGGPYPPFHEVAPGNRSRIVSTNGEKAIEFVITVLRVEGPTRGNSATLRGVKFMEMGYVQNLDVEKLRGLFDNTNPPQARYSTIEDVGVLLDSTAGSVWYDPANAIIVPPPPHAGLIAPLTDELVTNIDLFTNDKPEVNVSDTPVFSHGGVPFSPINRSEILANFFMYFAVRTKDNRNAASLIYTQRAEAKWHFGGIGAYTGANLNSYGTWDPLNTRVWGDTELVEIFSGERVPVTSFPNANTWSATIEEFKRKDQ